MGSNGGRPRNAGDGAIRIKPPLRETLSFASSNETQRMAQREIVEAVEKAMEARRQRIAVSQSTINRVKWFGLVLTGLCVLVGIALVHADNNRNCAIATALFATGMAVSLLLIASHSWIELLQQVHARSRQARTIRIDAPQAADSGSCSVVWTVTQSSRKPPADHFVGGCACRG